ncbi:GerAB/ArcD/ProY family transporter [Jeotgalibacillus sp. ET6]|uniref:GerAB/ArcD/ProY family transporter n=1 Tax=Jeotgalibacillus sp. ET6 TaxID=3037260 RepID=UPI002418410E|nr:GerAB/ArcD/ProY family transporter [Jeotgalibacillus sp. ET6]MDG5470557.1 GerAB/ArcD/ProY family transporter [Jeotgalibacillus sp. ET6]
MNAKNEITGWQLFFLIVQTQVGVGILSMPSDIGKVAKQDAWISMVLAGVLVQIIILLYIFLLSRFPEDTYFGIVNFCFGSILGKIIMSTYLLYFIGVLVASLTNFHHIIATWIFTDTPKWVIMLLFSIPAVYMARENIVLIARFKMLISFMLPILIFVLGWVYIQPQFLYLLPIGGSGLNAIIAGIKPAIFALMGFEAFLFFAFYVKTDRKKELRKGALATAFVTTFYVFTIITTQVFFYIKEIIVVPYPVLYIMKALKFTILERIDLVFITVWMVIALSSFISFLFIAGNTMEQLLSKQKHTKMVYFIMVMAFLGALIPTSMLEMKEFMEVLLPGSLIFTVAIPILTMIISLFKKSSQKEKSA